MSSTLVMDAPRDPVGLFRTLRTIVRNPMEAWPDAVYSEPVVRSRLLGSTTTFVSDPDLVKQVLVDDADHFIKADAMRRALEPALGRGILTAEGADWRFQRRTAAPVFRPNHVDSFIPAMLEASRRMRDAWSALPDGAVIDVDSEMMHVTFDIILETMLSGRGATDVAAVERSITDFLESTSWAIVLSALRAPYWTPFPGKRRAMRAQAYLRRTVRDRVVERRASGERRDDLLSLMLDARDPETGEGMSEQLLADNILTFIGAGHETTALALTWTFFLLSRHPEIERRVLAEIDAVTGGETLQADQVQRLTYTRQVIQEAMRVYPPVAMVVRQATDDLSLGGHRIGAGENVFIPIYAIHRHRRLWPDPTAFDPDRFTPEAVKSRHRYAWLPFGAGPRICIGMGFSLVEAVAILATLLPAVQLASPAGFRPTPKLRVTMRPAEGMKMTLRHR